MKQKGICDKCGKETECITEDFVCTSEYTDYVVENGKAREINVIRKLTTVTCRMCGSCAGKRKIKYFLVALLFAAGSVPLFITGTYFEMALVLLVASATVLFLSGNRTDMEYLAKLHYRAFREGKEGLILNPQFRTPAQWEKIKLNLNNKNFRVFTGEEKEEIEAGQ